jgi:hypothetical protein
MLCFVRMTPATLRGLPHPRANLLQWEIVWGESEKFPLAVPAVKHTKQGLSQTGISPDVGYSAGLGTSLWRQRHLKSGDWSSVGVRAGD